jgi:hypothetical protein
MPSIQEKILVDRGVRRTERRSKLRNDAVDDAVDRARLREMARRGDGERIPDEVIDQLLAGAQTEWEIAGPGGLLAQLTKRLVERAIVLGRGAGCRSSARTQTSRQ